MGRTKITIRRDGAGTRVLVDSDRLDADYLSFLFTDEGLITDAVLGGVVTGTDSRMYEDIEENLGDV